MLEVEKEYELLNTNLNNLVFDIGQGVDRKNLHNQAMRIIMQLNSLKQKVAFSENKKSDETIVDEINKIKRKLKRWVQRPNQINSIILNTYLDLEKKGLKIITDDKIKEIALKSGINKFESNFAQMCNIAPKNHGKIFDLDGKIVHLWEPIIPLVTEYKEERERLLSLTKKYFRKIN
ncbi:MAG: hypothetical protein R3D86_06485 [Emcibacteraceae bacterium]